MCEEDPEFPLGHVKYPVPAFLRLKLVEPGFLRCQPSETLEVRVRKGAQESAQKREHVSSRGCGKSWL